MADGQTVGNAVALSPDAIRIEQRRTAYQFELASRACHCHGDEAAIHRAEILAKAAALREAARG